MFDRQAVWSNWTAKYGQCAIAVWKFNGESLARPGGDPRTLDTVTTDDPDLVNGVPNIPSTLYFTDVVEGATILGYGAVTEHRIQQLGFEHFKHVATQVIFTSSTDFMQAHIRFAESEDAYPRVGEGTWIKISMLLPGDTTEQNITACCLNPSFGTPRGQVLFLVLGKNIQFFEEKHLLSTDTDNWINCSAQIVEDHASIKRKPEAQKFWPIFLNQHPRDLQETYPFEGIDPGLVDRKTT